MRLLLTFLFAACLVACSDSSRRPNQPPTLAGVVNVTVQANVASDVFTVTVSDDRTGASELDLTVTSDNSELLPDAAISISGGGASREVSVTPTAGILGTAVLTLTVTDAAGLATSATATVVVDRQEVVFSEGFRSVFDDGANDAPRELNSLAIDNVAAEGDLDDLLP